MKVSVNVIRSKLLLLCCTSLLGFFSFAQQDSIVFRDGKHLVGKTKSLTRGVLTFKTSFSNKDIKINWAEIREVYTSQTLLIGPRKGEREKGQLQSVTQDTVRIVSTNNEDIRIALTDIIAISQLKESFKERFFWSIDLGFSLTKANNLVQYSYRNNVGYRTPNFHLEAYFNGLLSEQDNVDATIRWDRGFLMNFLLSKNWFITPEIQFFRSTELEIDLRTTSQIGAGKILANTNKVYWQGVLGLAYNAEKFSSDSADRKSAEFWLGMDFDLYDLNDFDFTSRFNVYPNLTEIGRWRLNMNIDLKYDLPLGLYIKVGWAYNFDNMPVLGAPDEDYVIQTGLGWEW